MQLAKVGKVVALVTAVTGTGDGGGTSLLSTGAQNQPGGDDWVPEKFRVMGEDGKLNIEGSARKLAESYTHLKTARHQRGTENRR